MDVVTPRTAIILGPTAGGKTALAVAAAKLFEARAGRPAEIGFGAPRAGEIRHSLGDPDPANATLRLAGRTALRDGLANVLAWLRASDIGGNGT